MAVATSRFSPAAKDGDHWDSTPLGELRRTPQGSWESTPKLVKKSTKRFFPSNNLWSKKQHLKNKGYYTHPKKQLINAGWKTVYFKTSKPHACDPGYTQADLPVPEVLDFVSSMLVGVVASDTSAVPGTTCRFFWGMVGSMRRNWWWMMSLEGSSVKKQLIVKQ